VAQSATLLEKWVFALTQYSYIHILHQTQNPHFRGASRRENGGFGSGFGKVQDVSIPIQYEAATFQGGGVGV